MLKINDYVLTEFGVGIVVDYAQALDENYKRFNLYQVDVAKKNDFGYSKKLWFTEEKIKATK